MLAHPDAHPDGKPEAAAAAWHAALTVRGFLVAAVLGVVFCIITIKLNLGSAGMTPSLNIAASFTPQENAVVQTMASACYSLAGYSGFGSYLLAMGYQAYLNVGGAPQGQPGYEADAVIDPTPQRVWPYLLLVSFAGMFALLGLRNLLLLKWRLPYPSGSASGYMIQSLHRQGGEAAAAARKVRLLGLTALASFVFDAFKWIFQGPSYSCGFSTLPTFGRAALAWTWHFDFQQQYVGAGMLVPPVVAWSMMLGAVLSWGVMWPLLARREGDWYPAGLPGSDMQGLVGYKIWLSVGLLLGEGAHITTKAALLGDDAVAATEGGVAAMAFKESQQERVVREAVFRSCSIPWWVGPCGYAVLAALGIAFLPLLHPPAKWHMTLVAFLLGPPVALANAYGAGLTDQDNGANYATLALFLFAAWAGSAGNGVIAGCALMGVVMVCAVTASVLMQDFRTAYITQTSPTAMFVAQLAGTAMGVVFAPLAFFMFWSTGLVGRKDGPYPNPFADVSRGIAVVGTEGMDALPRHCGTLSAAFFAAGLLLCLLRDALPHQHAPLIPSPMGMAFSFYIGANNAIDFFLGSIIVMAWEWRRLQAALQLGPLLGAGLVVGDGLWAIPAVLLAIAGVSPPLCLKVA
ncbi:putative metal-nicotianamine transporter YSL6-like protein [Scenedesmus sp. NREL 46B-D3]|nr:putative metal-nicotianamine transporter YSL6-like protein [Scenedesmus sp. NREL 46B-D3]